MKKNIIYNLFNLKYFRSIINSKKRMAKSASKIKIPIIVLDKKTNKLFEYSSISETARSFDAYPKTI